MCILCVHVYLFVCVCVCVCTYVYVFPQCIALATAQKSLLFKEGLEGAGEGREGGWVLWVCFEAVDIQKWN